MPDGPGNSSAVTSYDVPPPGWAVQEARLRAALHLSDPPTSVRISLAPPDGPAVSSLPVPDLIGSLGDELSELHCAATAPLTIEGLAHVAGVDISFFAPRKNAQGETEEEAVGALVVLSYPALTTVHTVVERVRLDQPYVPTYLGFREAAVYRRLFSRLPGALRPQVVMVDGNGVLHPRGLGSACHLGIELGLPTIGVAKSLLHYDDSALREKQVKALFRQPDRALYPLLTQAGQTLGVALRPVPLASRAGSVQQAHNPIFVSQGHNVSLSTAIILVRACSRFRIPEPIRQADLVSRQAVREAAQEL